ncbi:MAG: right-handed parallel beta-helix repeat-containing protein [Acidobacteria bacterium]|uniref:Right-handed parallel beta-helix repeat-containing protein n=1 Tax=Candidatus Polarisedimenticola svalbardensis TaxID=2886004 RepID=A0A8J6XU78_9BACT|nr:right-handed parallel beta-helix repeat-containing protein [Candidatus Polarisedimenticola svalbardensis]
MLIRSRESQQRIRLPGRRRYRLILLLAVLALWSGLMFAAGFVFLDFIRPNLQSLTGRTSVASAVSALAGAPARWLAAATSGSEPEKLILDIPFESLHQIHQKRDEALAQGLLVTGSDDLVRAEIRHGDETHRVRLRLKGDLPDHLETEKWSLRIQVRGGDAILGMRRFSIQAPETRGFQAEPLFLEALRDEGILAPRYSFVEVVRNGKELGLMALEEHFSKELLESQDRREGVVLKFDETLFWENMLLNDAHGPYENYKTATISAFQTSRIVKNPILASDYLEARALLRGFVDGHLPASDVFDEKLLGRFLALSEIWGSIHAVRWHNLRLYYNPVDRELEPIGFDANLQAHHIDRNLLIGNEPICRSFLADPRVRSEFISSLQRLTGQVLDGTLISRWQDREKRYLHILNREYPVRAPIDFDPIVRRAEALQPLTMDALFGFGNALHTADTRYPEVVYARLIQTGEGHYLELANALPVQVSVGDIRIRLETEILVLPDSFVLAPTPFGDHPARHRVELPVRSDDPRPLLIEGAASIPGQAQPYRFIAEQYPEATVSLSVPNPTAEELLAGHDMLAFDDSTGMFHVGPGDYEVRRPLILPRDTGLRIEAGTTLRFGSESAVLIRGAVIMAGTEADPVILKPAGTVEDGWPGILVLGEGASSSLAWVQVENTTGFRLGGWTMTGGLTFHDSRVDLDHVSFLGTAAEDALNTIRSNFTLTGCDFSDTHSDAFDGDFSDGTISGGTLQRIGGDAIDFSGSNIEVDGTIFREIRDKAISVGEASVLSADNTRIENAGTGVVSKDRSTTTIRNCTMTGIVHVGLMAYVKKPEYGPAELVADKVVISGAGEPALAQTGSRVVVDGQEITAEELDVDALYEQGYMKK